MEIFDPTSHIREELNIDGSTIGASVWMNDYGDSLDSIIYVRQGGFSWQANIGPERLRQLALHFHSMAARIEAFANQEGVNHVE